jgi:hypothetical protein
VIGYATRQIELSQFFNQKFLTIKATLKDLQIPSGAQIDGKEFETVRELPNTRLLSQSFLQDLLGQV